MPNNKLIEHTKQFEKKIIKLSSNMYSAVGFAASNIHMIEGDKSLTIIDTSESTKAADNVLKEFRKISAKPIECIIYTHSHRDHISGAQIFSSNKNIKIIASSEFKSDLVDLDENKISPKKALMRRTQAQFGIGLSIQERVSLGCGPANRPMEGLGEGYIAPNHLINKNQKIDLDGVKAKLILAPGETQDHMVIWCPKEEVLFSGDNWYYSFPNLYAIRGTPYRDFQLWADSLIIMANLKPEVIAPGHTMPVFGKSKIQDVLISTSEAISHIIKHTSEGMDSDKNIDDIVDTIKLPDHIKHKPWLEEFYGKLSWSVKAYATGVLGWYDGNPTNLGNISSQKRALNIANLAGGIKNLFLEAEKSQDLQWKLELCDYLITLGEPAENLKINTMIKIAENEINATSRNSYLWEVLKLREKLKNKTI